MIFVLQDVIYYRLGGSNDTHIETEEEFESGVAQGGGEESGYSGRGPVILADV